MFARGLGQVCHRFGHRGGKKKDEVIVASVCAFCVRAPVNQRAGVTLSPSTNQSTGMGPVGLEEFQRAGLECRAVGSGSDSGFPAVWRSSECHPRGPLRQRRREIGRTARARGKEERVGDLFKKKKKSRKEQERDRMGRRGRGSREEEEEGMVIRRKESHETAET